MNDYFDNLVGKTLGVTPVVQPWAASLFEPQNLAQQIPVDSETTGFTKPMIYTESPERQRMTNRINPVSQIQPEPSDEFPATAISVTAIPQPIPSAPASVKQDGASAMQQNAINREDRIAQPQSSTENSLLAAPMAVRQTLLVPASTAPPVSVEPGSSGVDSPHKGVLVHPTIKPDLTPRTNNGFADSREPGALFDRITTRSVEPIAKPDTAPTIKITIGRVDVRAVMQPQSAPRSAPERKPSLSLEEYLKQRSEGKT